MCFSVLESWLLNSLKKMYSHTVKSENTVAKWPEDRQDLTAPYNLLANTPL